MMISDLIGKTITELQMMKLPGFSDRAWMRLAFADGTECFVVSDHGGHGGPSIDEYPDYISVRESITLADWLPPNLMPEYGDFVATGEDEEIVKSGSGDWGEYLADVVQWRGEKWRSEEDK